MVARTRWLLCAGLGSACAASAQHPVPVAVLIDGDRAAVGGLPAVDGLALRELALPSPPPPPVDATSATLTAARGAYERGDLDACRRELAGVDVVALLAAGDRAFASRVLAFDTACAWGARTKGDALADAARFASFGLEIPTSAVAPDVEAVLGDAIAAVGAVPQRSLRVTGEVGARLTIDGRPAGCAVPCTVSVSTGDHVLAVEADGFAPAARLVRSPDVEDVALTQVAAAPALAAQQWRARVGRGLPADDATGAALVARFGGERRIAWLHGDARLAGTLIVDGAVRARSDGPRGGAAPLLRELAYDGGVVPRPAVWQRPAFWIVVSTAALAIAGGIVAVTYSPPIHNFVSIH